MIKSLFNISGSFLLMNLELSKEQLTDIQAAVVYYMQRHISIKNPRYDEYEVILQMLSKSIRNTQ